MLAGARRLAAAAVQGGASRCSAIPRPRDGLRSLTAGTRFHIPLRHSSSDSAPPFNAATADATSPLTENSRKPFASLFSRSRRCSSSDSAGPFNAATADPTSPRTSPARKPLSALFSRPGRRLDQKASVAGSAATRVHATYSTSAGGAGPMTASSRLEEAPRPSLSSLFSRTRGRGSGSHPSTSAPEVSPPLPAPQQLGTAAAVSPPLPATTTGPTASLSGLFSGKPIPPPFSASWASGHLPYLNVAAPSAEPLEPLSEGFCDSRYSDVFTLEELFDPVKFAKKYPLVVLVRPLFAQDSNYDRWTLTEVGKELARSLPSTVTQAHAKGKSYERFRVKDLVVAANLSNPDDIRARFIIRVPTKTSTPESMTEDLQNSGLSLKELMEISAGTPEFWDKVAKDVKSFMTQLETPLEERKRYLTVNHSCLLPLEVMSQAFLICFQFLFMGRVPGTKIEDICDGLPYSNEKWKKIALENPLFKHMLIGFREYLGDSQTLQVKWRRNVVSHKTTYGDNYPPLAVDIMLQLYFPDFMQYLLTILFDHGVLIPLNLHRLFRR